MFTMELVEYYANQINTEIVLCASLVLNYYLFVKLSSANDCIEELTEEYSELDDELERTKTHVKFYRYCFNTQKRAEKVFKKEIATLKLKLITQERKTEEEPVRKRSPPPFSMTLRERDETGTVKRRKTSTDSVEGSDSEATD